MRKLLIASTSTVHGQDYLAYCEDCIRELFSGCQNIAFLPYARPSGISHDNYTLRARDKFSKLGLNLRGIHETDDPIKVLEQSDGVFAGGGNTFVLLDQLYQQNLIPPLRERVAAGMPYMGTSAGSNITGLTINTTNDMPIVYPPSFEALQLVPFNLNPHYLDPDPNSTHMGETRETRIREFHQYHQQRVIGLREGSWLNIEGDEIHVGGSPSVRIFEKDRSPYELQPNEDFSFLLAKSSL